MKNPTSPYDAANVWKLRTIEHLRQLLEHGFAHEADALNTFILALESMTPAVESTPISTVESVEKVAE